MYKMNAAALQTDEGMEKIKKVRELAKLAEEGKIERSPLSY
jgi:hypothetical protein